MRDVVSTGPLSYRSSGSIRSLPTTCTHEVRRGRGSYTTGRENLSLSFPPISLALLHPLYRSTAFPPLPAESRSSHAAREDDIVFHPLHEGRVEQAPKLPTALLLLWPVFVSRAASIKFNGNSQTTLTKEERSTRARVSEGRRSRRPTAERLRKIFKERNGKESASSKVTASMVITLATLPEVTAQGDHGLVGFSLSLFVSIVEGCAHPLSLAGVGARLNHVGACRLDGAGC